MSSTWLCTCETLSSKDLSCFDIDNQIVHVYIFALNAHLYNLAPSPDRSRRKAPLHSSSYTHRLYYELAKRACLHIIFSMRLTTTVRKRKEAASVLLERHAKVSMKTVQFICPDAVRFPCKLVTNPLLSKNLDALKGNANGHVTVVYCFTISAHPEKSSSKTQ